VIHTGIDLVAVSRIKQAYTENPASFLKRICTEQEIAYLKNHARKDQKLAGIFALKEAFSKALGTGLGATLSFQDIEIEYSSHGQPRISYRGSHFAPLSSGWELSCSVSHEGDLLTAIVILSGRLS
jgi:holo-[acyl-carrier protein] synthase